jgi:hypothetical protein
MKQIVLFLTQKEMHSTTNHNDASGGEFKMGPFCGSSSVFIRRVGNNVVSWLYATA